jgi:pyruvate dehydrogenase E1 component alpha subunit
MGEQVMEAAAPATDLPVKQLLDFYHEMVLIRRFDEKAAELYTQGKIGGFLHLSIGEEAVAVGALHALEPRDHVITHYRDHAHALARGLNPKAVMAELLGKETGVSHGRGGSMHLANVKLNFWGGHAIVGGHLPMATGLALAAQYTGEDRVVLAIFGDGATNIGSFHESLNMAAVWKLPVLFLCENNQYGMGTAVTRASARRDIADKACAYGMPAEMIDGMDVIGVYQQVQAGLDYCRSGEGPFFIEACTYRYRGHSMGDPERYRAPEEVEYWKELDPIDRLGEHLVSSNLADQARLDQIKQQVEDEMAEIVRFAEESPAPSEQTLFDQVFVEG